VLVVLAALLPHQQVEVLVALLLLLVVPHHLFLHLRVLFLLVVVVGVQSGQAVLMEVLEAVVVVLEAPGFPEVLVIHRLLLRHREITAVQILHKVVLAPLVAVVAHQQ
jgi:hypothetical protein